MFFIIKKLILELQDTYDILDEENHIKYKIKSDFFSNVKKFVVYDSQDNEICIMKRKFASVVPLFIVENDDKEIANIKKESTFLRAKYTISYNGYTIIADSFNCKFKILDKNENEIGKIERIQLQKLSTHKIELNEKIQDKISELCLILMVVIIEELRVKNKKRKVRNK